MREYTLKIYPYRPFEWWKRGGGSSPEFVVVVSFRTPSTEIPKCTEWMTAVVAAAWEFLLLYSFHFLFFRRVFSPLFVIRYKPVCAKVASGVLRECRRRRCRHQRHRINRGRLDFWSSPSFFHFSERLVRVRACLSLYSRLLPDSTHTQHLCVWFGCAVPLLTHNQSSAQSLRYTKERAGARLAVSVTPARVERVGSTDIRALWFIWRHCAGSYSNSEDIRFAQCFTFR